MGTGVGGAGGLSAEALGAADDNPRVSRRRQRIYSAVAERLVAAYQQSLAGALVLDAGSGTGLVGRAAVARGARVVAVDVSSRLLHEGELPVAVVGDVMALPLRAETVDVVLSGFCLNHLAEPVTALTEFARVVRRGGAVLASTWPADDEEPVRAFVERALTAAGWRPPAFYAANRRSTGTATGDPRQLAELAIAAGLVNVAAEVVTVEMALTPVELLAWRLERPHTAPFVASLPAEQRTEMVRLLTAELGGVESYRPQIVVLSSRRAA